MDRLQNLCYFLITCFTLLAVPLFALGTLNSQKPSILSYHDPLAPNAPCPPGTVGNSRIELCKITNVRLVSRYKDTTIGDTQAMNHIADHYIEEREVGAAFLWYRKAAQSGDLRALTRQGIILHEARTYQTEGLKYILDAAKRNYSPAQMFLGAHFLEPGENQDLNKAIFWLSEANRNGHDKAQELMRTLMKRLQEDLFVWGEMA